MAHDSVETMPRAPGVLTLEALDQKTGVEAFLRAKMDGAGRAQAIHDLIAEGLKRPDLDATERLASAFAKIRYGVDEAPGLLDTSERLLSQGKLAHDLLQLNHLRCVERLGPRLDEVIDAYQAALNTFGTAPETRRRIDLERELVLDRYYGRILHVADCPRLTSALSCWSRSDVERIYLTNAPGIVVIDDFLTDEALASLRHFCESSTVWHKNRYAYGRLGAFFLSGFSCPLLAQIAEDLRAQLPTIIGAKHPLRQLWGFKYPSILPPDSTVHADFAAVNVNFWITPEDANNNPETGGLVIYEDDAPREWAFSDYNSRINLIREYLNARQSRSVYIPYRANRAIVFNSDLFHATAAVDFNDAYVDRRINITMLFGDRSDDQHHPSRPQALARGRAPSRAAWRSTAFKGRRL